MRQVPNYLIIGNGRVAKHFAHYFHLLGEACVLWSRAEPLDLLATYLNDVTHILVLIKDDAILSFAEEHLLHRSSLPIIHFSAALAARELIGAHPLMTFNNTLYTLSEYQTIPFVLDDHAPPFSELFPAFSNPHVRIALGEKCLYHAHCVLSGNLTAFVWQKFVEYFEKELEVPSEFANSYMKVQFQNVLLNPRTAMTGPLKRNDQGTIAAHLDALSEHSLLPLYQGFINSYFHQGGSNST